MGALLLPSISLRKNIPFFAILLIVFGLVQQAFAQGSLACNPSIEVALDINCQATIDPDDILEGSYDDFSIFTLTIPGVGSGNTVTITAPGTYTISVADPSGNSCWGSIDATDGFPPILTCTDVSLGCTDNTDPVAGPSVPGILAAFEPVVMEPCGPVTLTHSDQVIEGTCTNPFRRQILRTWTAVNGSGLSGSCVQTITVLRATVADVTPPVNFDGFEEPSFLCTDFPDNPGLIPDEDGHLEVSRTCIATDFTLPLQVAANSTVTVNFTASDIPSVAEVSEIILQEFSTGNLTFQLTSPSGTTRSSFQFANGFDGENPDGNWTLNIINNNYNAQVLELSLIVKFKVNLAPGGAACDNLQFGYTDTQIPICEGSYKILRTWNVLDWCVPGGAVNFSQVLKVEDKKAPVIDCPDNIIIGTNFNDCEADAILPVPALSDDCTAEANLTYTVALTSPSGVIVPLPSGGFIVQGLPIGTHTVLYTAQDACGNTSQCEVQINVQDLTVPAMVCESFHVVSLQNLQPGQVTQVFAQTFDDGSWDNCGPVTFSVRKLPNGGFGPTVSFSCADVGETVMVELRGRDIYNNFNTCMVEVTVDDKVDPILSCPPNRNINCAGDVPAIAEDIQANPGPGLAEVFRVIQVVNGFATYTDDEVEFLGYYPLVENCLARIYIREAGSVNNCGVGSLSRIWQAEDVSGNRSASCVQIISVSNNDPLTIVDTDPACTPFSFGDHPQFPAPPHSQFDDVEWPCDVTVSCTGPDDSTDPASAGEPEIFEDECDITAVTFEDLELPVTGSECRKILRKWIIVDWCQFEEVNGIPVSGYWTYTQIIKVNDTNDPVITGCEDLAPVDADPQTCNGFVELIASASDACTDSTFFNWSYVIDPGNDGQGANITGEGADASGNFPIGEHKITWTVEDGCGNKATCEQLFYVVDNAGPNLVVITSTDVSLVPQVNGFCVAELWASELDLSSFDVCSGLSELVIQNPSLGLGQTAPPSTASSGTTFSEADIPFVNIDLWGRDGAGNWSYVIVQVVVEDNIGACQTPMMVNIFGTIETEEQEGVAAVDVTVSGVTATGPVTIATNSEGQFHFELPPFQNYTVEAEKDNGHLDGVTTYDLVVMSRHILGIEVLDSPYKMIAADINNSGAITAYDMVALRKLILFIDESFPNNQSWRFVDAAYIFPDPSNPFATTFPEVVSFNGLEMDNYADFVGVKIGDLNNSINLGLNAGDTRDQNETLTFQLKNQTLEPGQNTRIDFRAKDFRGIEGYQFALQFNPEILEFVDVIPGDLAALSTDNFGFSRLNDGILTTSWNGTTAAALPDDAILFSIDLLAKQKIELNKVLWLNTNMMQAEAYNENVSRLNLALDFIGELASSAGFSLAQNQPNPFRQETMIRFELPAASTATLSIYDMSGRQLHVVSGEFAQGWNELTIEKEALSATGVLYYQLDTPNDSATKKMILLK